MPPTPAYRAGKLRKQMRKELNVKEINALDLIQQFDTHNNGRLDSSELGDLMAVYNKDKPPQDWEVKYVHTVADKDNDNYIDENEVLFALAAWTAFTKIPQHLLEGSPLQGCTDPSKESIRELLIKLNNNQQVEDEEVDYVHATLLSLMEGDKVSNRELRGAVSPWFLHVDREDTTAGQKFGMALERTLQHALGQNTSQAGDVTVDQKKRLAGCGGFVAILIPMYLLYVSLAFPTGEDCERDLNWVLRMTSLLLLCTLGCIGVGTHQRRQGDDITILPMVCCLLCAGVVGLMTGITGTFWTLSSSASECGRHLYNICNWVYVIFPVIALVMVCCLVPCVFVLYLLYQGQQVLDADRRVQQVQHPTTYGLA